MTGNEETQEWYLSHANQCRACARIFGARRGHYGHIEDEGAYLRRDYCSKKCREAGPMCHDPGYGLTADVALAVSAGVRPRRYPEASGPPNRVEGR